MGSRIRFSGIFTPEQIEELREELKRGDRPGESVDEREERAIEILNRRNIERVDNDAQIRRTRGLAHPAGEVLRGATRAAPDRGPRQ